MSADLKAVPARSPDRQRLADAIERQADAVFQHQRVVDALEQLDTQIYGSLEKAVRRAREHLDDAHAGAPALLVARALGEPADPDQPTVAEAENALKVADQALVDAKKARSTLRDELRAREYQVDQAKRAIDSAVKAVASDPQRAVMAEFNRAGRHLLRISRVMRTLGIVHTGLTANDIGLHFQIGDIAMPGDHNRSLYAPEPTWAATLTALNVDPDAQFPALPAPEEPEPERERAEAAAAA